MSYSLDSYLEEDSSAEELSEDASDGPHVDGVGVVLGAHEDLGRAVQTNKSEWARSVYPCAVSLTDILCVFVQCRAHFVRR